MEENNYLKYRGKCLEECEKLVEQDSSLKLVRGYYYEPLWNTKEQHWWCVDRNGNIVDPTRLQFPSEGVEEFYEEFDGYVECSQCGKRLKEEDADIEGRYAFCSTGCHLKFVGL